MALDSAPQYYDAEYESPEFTVTSAFNGGSILQQGTSENPDHTIELGNVAAIREFNARKKLRGTLEGAVKVD